MGQCLHGYQNYSWLILTFKKGHAYDELIGHFRVAVNLTMKARLSAKLFK